MLPLTYFIFLLFLGFSTANEEPTNIFLTGSELFNEEKRQVLEYFHNFAEIDRVFNQAAFNPNIVIVGNQLDHFSLFKENKFVQFHSVKSNASAVILTLKGLGELNLEEIQVLHQLIYATNGGLVAIEIGPSVVQTKSLLEYSAFCWAKGRLTSKLTSDSPNQVFLCNGIRPSSVDFLDKESVVPLNKKIEPTVLPIAPEPRFWPTFVVSAAEADSKKQRSSKHTAQPNARQTRVYGKKKSDSAGDAEVVESPTALKLGCKYRYSCYEDAGIKTNKPAARQAKSDDKSAEKQTKEVPKKSRGDSSEKVEVNLNDKSEYKLQCKFRKSCYETGKLDLNAINEAKQHIPKAAPKEVESIDDDEGRDAKLKCKFRKSCYETGKLDIDAIRESKQHVPKAAPKEEKPDKEFDERSLKFDCKYRKSCIEDKLSEAPTHGKREHKKPSSQEHRRKKSEEPELPPVEVDEPKESPKHKEKQSKNSIPPKRRPIASKNDDQIEVNIDGDLDKLKCKFRKSCYETGKLDLNAVHEAKQHVPKAAPKVAPKEEKQFDERSLKFDCKYRKSCIEALQKEDKPAKKVREIEPESLPVPIVVEEVQVGEESEEIDEEVQTEEEPEEIQIEEEPEEVDETPKPKSARKSKESSTEFRKKDPNRYVNKFKNLGKYEKLPKSAIFEEEELVEEEEPVEEEGPIANQNEDDDVSAEIAEPIEPEVEDQNQQIEPEPESALELGEQQVEPEEIHTVIQQTVDEPDEGDTHTNKDDAAPAVSLQTKVACKYRKSCMRTGVLPNLEEERKNAKIRATTIVHETQSTPSENEELDRVKCKYRLSCYKQNVPEDKANKREISPPKLADDRKPKEEQKSIESDEEEAEAKANQTVVDLNSITTADRLNCKYRTSCYTGIKHPVKHRSATRIIPVPSQSPRYINSKCHEYYLSCRQEMGLAPKEHAPKVNGRRLCRKKKSESQ